MASHRITPKRSTVSAAVPATCARPTHTIPAAPPAPAAGQQGLKRAALYARVSTEKQEREETVASQVDLLYQAATASGYDIAPTSVFIDEGVSGARLDRPALDRLRDLAAEGAFEVLLVTVPDRLARRYAYQVLLVEEFTRCGCEVIFAQHGLGASPEEQMLLQMQGVFAEYERALIQERTRRGRLFAARQGRVNWGNPPYGYTYIRKTPTTPQHLVINEDEAEVVRLIYRWCGEEQLSSYAIQRGLTAQGIVPRKARHGRWAQSSIIEIPRDALYKGEAYYNRTQAREVRQPYGRRGHQDRLPGNTQGRTRRPPSEWIAVPVPAIIDPETWERVQGQPRQNHERAQRHTTPRRYLLRSLLVCGQCGRRMVGSWGAQAFWGRFLIEVTRHPSVGHRMGDCVYPIPPRRIPMSCHPRVTEWTITIQTYLPHLTKPQATVLALWSLGMVLARSCALTAVSAFLATWLHRKEDTVRQQLREFCYEAPAKRGAARQALVVETYFVPLLAWIVAQWEGTQLALALDATTLGTRFTVLVLSVVYRGCAIPVAWTVLAATAKHAWRREWLRMLRQIRRAVPGSWTVIVLADRGLYARWLFRRITRLGWHPFLRINTGGTFRPQGHVRGVSLKSLVPEPGMAWQGTGIAFKGRNRQLHCTLLACWEAGYKDPWLILTDLPPEASTACRYGLRAWIEQGFKITKRAGWQWHRTHMTKPERAARLWLAVAVATLWLLSVGGEAEETIPASTVPDVTALIPAQPRMRRATRLRLVSVFRRGWNLILVALLDQAPLPMGRFVPEPWPTVMALEEQAPLLPNLEVPLAA